MGKINFEGSDQYRQATTKLVAAIEANPAGKVIVSGIRNADRNLTIIDYADPECNAKTHAEDYKAGAPEGVGGGDRSKAPWYKGHSDDPATRDKDERFDAIQGRATGGGSNVTIKFNPEKYQGAAGCYDGNYGTKGDEVMMHEMVHALRYMQGLYNQIPTEDNALEGYENEEEFLAIVATNVYMSAKGGTQLRAHHVHHTALAPELSTSEGFLSDPMNLKLLNIYRLTWTTEFLGFSNVITAKFNPFRVLTRRLRDFPVGNIYQQVTTEYWLRHAP